MAVRNIIIPGGGGAAGGGNFSGGVSTDGNTAGTTGVVGSQIEFVGSNNITLSQSVNGGSATISIIGGAGAAAFSGGLSNIGNTLGDTGVVTARLVLAGGNNITLSGSTNGGSMTVTVSAFTQTVQTQNVLAAIVSGANGNGTFTSGTLSVKAGNNITLSTGAGVYSIHGVASQTAQSGISGIIVSDASYTTGTVSFSNAGNITISSSVNGATQYIRLSGNSTQSVQTQMTGLTAGLSNIGNTAGDTVIVSNRIVFAGGNNITLSGSSNAGSMTITISGAAAGGAQTAISGIIVSDATYTSGTVSFSNQANITIGSSVNGATQYIRLSGNAAQTVQTQNFVAVIVSGANGDGTYTSGTLSVKAGNNVTLSTGVNVFSVHGGAGGGGIGAGVSTGGNTLGSTGTVTTGNVVFVGISNGAITLSQSTGAAGSAATITISVPQTSSLVGALGLSVSTNGSTLSVQPIPVGLYNNLVAPVVYGSAQDNSSASVQPFYLQWPLVATNIRVGVSVNVATAANNSSAFLDLSVSGVIYSRNVSTLSSLVSFSNTMTQTWTSNASQTATGLQYITATFPSTTLTPGSYFMCVHLSTTNSATAGAATTALARTVFMVHALSITTSFVIFKDWVGATNVSKNIFNVMGCLQTNATRATVDISAVSQSGASAALGYLYFELRNSTLQG